MFWLRAYAVWLVIILAESIHGVLRGLFLAPLVGDLRARRIAVFTGALIIVGIVTLFIRWLRPASLGAMLGTGVGGGLVLNGRVLEGHNAIAGEWGHNPLPWADDDERPGPACYCGQVGCIETFLSGPALAADHARHGGGTADAATIVARAAAGDTRCLRTLERYESRLARAVAHLMARRSMMARGT